MAIRHATAGSASSPPLSAAGLQAWDADHIGYELLANDAPNQDFNLSGGGTVTILSKSIQTIVAKDAIWIEYWATVLNNSGGGRVYTTGRNLGSFNTSIATATINNTSPARVVYHELCSWSVSATNLAYVLVDGHITQPIATSTAGAFPNDFPFLAWNTNTGNNTGTQTAVMTWASDGAVATQTLTLHSYKIWRVASAP